jgi:hypothetical protein
LSWAWQFHHNKALMEQIRVGSYVPYTFHMCWTQTKADKLKVGATAPCPHNSRLSTEQNHLPIYQM